ncbi:MAG TPA: DUF4293 domain-containing protein [Puia sp.]|jgi:hypothetical protein|nr:DUF4293 domain-containing protein [Puia sp.]
MLQRKQTLWMLAALICSVLTFNFAFYTGNVLVGANGHVFMRLRAAPNLGFGKDSASAGSVLILVITVIIILGLLYDIFMFKARKKQVWIIIGLIVLSLLNIFLYWNASQPPHFVEGNYGMGALLSLAIPVFLFMAARGIRKDEKLVKSADRLR